MKFKMNVNQYMRGVAVVSLLVVGGLGVYKGRNMMSKAGTPDAPAGEVTADAADSPTSDTAAGTITDDGTSTSPTISVASTESHTTASAATPAPIATKKPKFGENKSKLGSFKFGGAGKTDKATLAASDPTTADSALNNNHGTAYGLNDDSPATSSAIATKSASAAPPLAPSFGGYGDSGYGASSVSPATSTAPPAAPSFGAASSPAYGGATDQSLENGVTATSPPETPSYSAAAYGDIAAPPSATGSTFGATPGAASALATSPRDAAPAAAPPEAPAYGAADNYGATPTSGYDAAATTGASTSGTEPPRSPPNYGSSSPVSPPANNIGSTSRANSKVPRNIAVGAAATAALVGATANDNTAASPASSKFTLPKKSPPAANGAGNNTSVGGAPPASSFATTPNYDSPSATNARTLPPNRLPGNTLEASVPARAAATSPRYAQDLNAGAIDAAATGALVGAVAGGTAIPASMEGPQTPTIAVEKFAPPEVQVGKAALFEIVVKNVGKVPAYDVTVVDEIPHGTRFQQASPQPSPSQTGALVWKLGAMQPGEEKIIELQLVPETEGEIGSIAQVSFQTQAGARSVVTRPRLELQHQAPTQVHTGENATVAITISNTGSGAATNVLLQGDIPVGFTHPAGKELEFEVGTIRPNESKQIELVLKAQQAGQYEGVFVVRGDGDLVVQDSARIEVVAPGLQVSISGPKKRFVERQATHAITIANPGTAVAKNVDIVARLPRGFKFISADHQGQYDAREHAVVWGLEELPPGASGTVQITTLPVEAGEQKLRVEGRSANGLTAEFEQMVTVDAASELQFTVHDLADPIEVGSETVYEVRVLNRGAKDATNVTVALNFPPEVKPSRGEGASTAVVTGARVDFAPIAHMAPGAEAIYKVHAQGLRAGDHRISVSLSSDEQQTPITSDESTRVYADQ